MQFAEFVEWAQSKWKETAIALATSLGVALLVFLATGRNGDLLVWVSEENTIYPSPQTRNLALPLQLAQTPVKSLMFVNMQVANAGKGVIGSQEGLWSFRITGPQEAILVLLGEPKASSSRVVVSAGQNPAANALSVQVGSLEPREFFDVRFLVANANGYPKFQLETSLKGLPPPILTVMDPQDRAAYRIAGWIWAALFALMMYEAVRQRHRPEQGPGMLREVKSWHLRLLVQVVLAALLSAFASVFLAKGIGWVAVKLWQWGVLS